MAEREPQGDDLFGWVRLAAAVLGVSLLPVWVVLTVVLAMAGADPAIDARLEDGSSTDPGIAVRLLVAGAASGIVVGAVALIVAAVGVVVAVARSMGRRAEEPPAMTPLGLKVTRRRLDGAPEDPTDG